MCSVIAKFKFDLEETIMKKILAIVIAMVMVLSLSVSVFAEEIVVFNNPEGEAFSDLVDPWDFYGIGGFWGRAAANVLDITIDEVKEIAREGGATFTMVFTGTEYGDSAPNLTFDFSDPQAAAQFVVTDNGDGTYTATAEFDDLVAAWEANGKTIDDIQNLLVQPNFSDFKLISATISTGEDAVEVTPVEDETPAEDETPVDTTETPAETGIVLAVLPMAVAAAAAVVAKKRK
mgnify:CR=1 FL=1